MTELPSEAGDTRFKRLRMRSWRRGMREMDLLLGPFADAELAALPPALLDIYEDLLSENDPDLYSWMVRKNGAPQHYREIVGRIARYHRID